MEIKEIKKWLDARMCMGIDAMNTCKDESIPYWEGTVMTCSYALDLLSKVGNND